MEFTEEECKKLGIDPGIRDAVRLLVEAGIETFESCEGGKGHAFPEPTIRFHGGRAEGYKALAIAIEGGLNVDTLRRYWDIQDGELHGPYWEITLFSDKLIDEMGSFL